MEKVQDGRLNRVEIGYVVVKKSFHVSPRLFYAIEIGRIGRKK